MRDFGVQYGLGTVLVKEEERIWNEDFIFDDYTSG